MLVMMGVFKVALFYTFLVFFLGGNHSSEGCNNDLTSASAAVRLSNDLFCAYDRNIRPVINQSSQITVETKFFIFNVHMNEKWDILQMSIQLLMEWKDEFLVWDPSKYDNIERMYEESSHVWIPDIMSYDIGFNGDDNREFSYFLPTSMVKISNKGWVKYNHRITLNAQCTTNIAKWPFDSHNCTFLIGSPVYTTSNVNYTFPSGYSANMFYYNPDREWELSKINQECMNIVYTSSNSSVHCILEYDINVTRFSTMYYSSIVIPAVVISLMKILTFLMGRETKLRFILLSLIFISELLYIQFLDTKLPNNGKKAVYIVLLYRNSLILTSIALVITVISNALYKHGTDDFPRNGPEWLKSVSTFLLSKKPIAMLTNFNTRGAELLIEKNMEEETPNTQRDENALFWKTLSTLLDRLSFVISLIISLINLWFLIP
ncbi:neuronal acetylcholine receptor subunit beta-2-like [Rhopalosiphum maidis]|uniref:neuronal acetylcholine receptor subunit beta-2-like n=1 Tax=Rhopalosiphum maidis TaxID=43146 RepID=UPI000F00DCE1|nr:neuronal acetylcholine receptor subunit beta-2-like [Rhopalosiphum maidis]